MLTHIQHLLRAAEVPGDALLTAQLLARGLDARVVLHQMRDRNVPLPQIADNWETVARQLAGRQVDRSTHQSMKKRLIRLLGRVRYAPKQVSKPTPGQENKQIEEKDRLMTQPGRLAGKRALVTGGSRGIGAAIVRRLAAEGAAVAVNYVADQTSADALVGELRAKGHQVAAFQADVSDVAQTKDLMERVVTDFGGLDLLASNAGVEYFGPLDAITQADFDRVFQINVAGQLFATQAAVAAMSSGGRILLTSSVSARIAVHQHTLYAASKAAVSAMVLNLAPELAERGIAINAIAPGGTATDMAAEHTASYTPQALKDVPLEAVLKSMNALGRLAEPDEIATAATFLLSPDASYITGSTLDAAGGWI